MRIDPAGITASALTAAADRSSDLRKAAEAFEALLLQSLVQRMRQSQLTDGFFGSSAGSSVYEGMFEQFLSDELAARSPLGIADLLEQRWSEQLEGEVAPEEAGRMLAAKRAGQTYRAVMDGITASALGPAPSVSPVGRAAGQLFSRDFGPGSDPIDGRPRFHGGVDMPAPTGTPVRSLAAGRISSVEERGGYGLRVEVEHAGGWMTTYSHLSGADVSPGQPVTRGQRIGAVGNSGRSTGPHLHFEALRAGQKVDPRRASHGSLAAQVLGKSAEEIDER